MADFSLTVRNRIVDYVRGGGSSSAINGNFLDLFNGDPQASGSSVLLTITGSSSRPNITSNMSAASAGATANSSLITIANAAVGGATVTHIAVYDAATGGNLLYSHALTSGNVTVTAGNPVQINANGLTFSVT